MLKEQRLSIWIPTKRKTLWSLFKPTKESCLGRLVERSSSAVDKLQHEDDLTLSSLAISFDAVFQQRAHLLQAT